MIVFLVFLAAITAATTLWIAWLSDSWEREPVRAIEDFFLQGVLTQFVLVSLGQRLLGFENWSALGLGAVLVPAALLLPTLLATHAEFDEAYDGIVYAVAFVAGASLVLTLWDIPDLVRDASGATLPPGALLGPRDLLLAVTAPSILARIGLHISVMAVAGLAGAVLGMARHRYAQTKIAGSGAMLLVVVTVVAAERIAGSPSWLHWGLVLAVGIAAYIVKQRSPFKGRPEALESEVVVKAFKATLMVVGAAVLVLSLLGTLVAPDRFDVSAPDSVGERH